MRPVVTLMLLALAGCNGPARVAYNPHPPPPAKLTETVPQGPVSTIQLIWQPGHWDWDGNGYVWRPGDYVALEGHGNQWQDGYWSPVDGRWAWVPAHWV